MPIKIVEWSRAIAHPARSPGLKTPENSSLHYSLANLRCMHVTEVVMYDNVLHYIPLVSALLAFIAKLATSYFVWCAVGPSHAASVYAHQ